MERHAAAYLIMAVMAAAMIGWAILRWHRGRARTYLRRRTREIAAHDLNMANKATGEDL